MDLSTLIAEADSRATPANDAALQLAVRVLAKLALLGAIPDRPLADMDGGIALYFFDGPRYSLLLCDNDGEIGALTFDRQKPDSMSCWDIDAEEIPEADLLRVLAFVGRCPSRLP